MDPKDCLLNFSRERRLLRSIWGADPVGGIFPHIGSPRRYTGRRDRIGWYVYGSAGLPSPRRSIPPELTSLSRSCCKRWGYPGAP